jgi:hypothetical protein
MTNAQAHAIAELAISVHDKAADLRVSEERGSYHEARDRRRALAAAQAKLERAITEAVER